MAPMIGPGFADPVLDAQACFRGILAAYSYPGRVIRLTGPKAAPAPLWPSSAAICQTLVDRDTPLWLDARAAGAASAVAYIRFHCGARIVAEREQSDFALVTVPAALPPVATLRQGDDAEPHRSTTLILQVASLIVGERITLSGPGIEHTRSFAVSGVPQRFWAERAVNHAQFPRGIDVLLAAPEAIVALPRTVKAEC